MNNPSEAMRHLAPQLAQLLRRVRDGSPTRQDQCAEAAQLAARLTHLTRDGTWLTQAFQLYARAKRALPSEVIEELFSLPPQVQMDLGVLRVYLTWLEDSPDRDNHDVSRLQSFVRLMASR